LLIPFKIRLQVQKAFFLVSSITKIAGLTLALLSCSTSDKNKQDVERWTSTDPLSVSLRLRSQKHLKGNLVENPSFEDGKIKIADSVLKQVKIDGWEIIGNDIQWISAIENNAFNNSNEVHKRLHSIQIIRTSADETESLGHGVLSDYIKVIPGNYTFSLYLNLKKIKNPKSRLGTKIYDAIDIRVLYYDRNKLQIAGEQYSSYYNQKINSGFKGYSFANYEKIDSTGWLHIIGRSQLFPFPDGDLPDETKFVRLFVGLKGTGSLWADDISYTYNNQNFTLEERLSIFFDSTYTKAQLIIPQPRNVQILESKVYYRPDRENNIPLILIPNNADPLTQYSALKLERAILDNLTKIGKVDKLHPPTLIRHFINNGQKNATIIFSLGKTELYNKYWKKLPLDKIKGHDQGYFIYTLNSLADIVFINGNSPEGNLYAVQSLIQLFDNQRLLFHNANIIDYPSNNYRSLLIKNNAVGDLKFLNSSNSLRFNEIYYPFDDEVINRSQNYYETAIRNNKYIGLEDGDTNSNAKEIQSLLKSFSNSSIGTKFLISFLLSKKINIKEAMNQYYETPEKKCDGLSYLKPLIASGMQKGIKFEVMQVKSDNLDLNSPWCDKFELNDLICKNMDVKYVWSGYGLQSWQIDEADLFSAKQYYSSYPVFIDFTMYPRSASMNFFANDSISPYKLMTACLFEAYDNNVVPEVYEKSNKSIVVYKCTDIFDKIRLKTASDFYWNREGYNPDISLYKALIDEFGFDASRKIIKFNVIYFKARSELILATHKKNMPRHARRAIQFITELKKIETDLKSKKYNASVKEVISIFADLLLKLEATKDKLNYTPMFR
jgi:hypothetical protein